MAHKTKIVSVRAPIDELIVPLVQRLLEFPEVCTMYSCQGEPHTKPGWDLYRDAANLVFIVGSGSAVEAAVFLAFLADHRPKLRCSISISLAVASDSVQIEFRHMNQQELPLVAEWLDLIRPLWLGLATEFDLRKPVLEKA